MIYLALCISAAPASKFRSRLERGAVQRRRPRLLGLGDVLNEKADANTTASPIRRMGTSIGDEREVGKRLSPAPTV